MSIASDTTPKIEFVTPLAGLTEHKSFELDALDEDGVFYTLKSTSDPDLRLVLADPMPFYPDYTPVIDGSTAEAIQLTNEDDGAVLAVVNMAQGAEKATMNLLAPIVVNPKAHRAAQAVLYGEDHPLDAPLKPGNGG
ncbi:flagellar assembly protein FliW [Kineococcus rhizosphaerae]|uniref:Flagellar assembly factor FliW n=1 Tax=Kineococcus rhizosphaerae TaxID=559628 RepID=A0A2T0RAS9_9ACTN|nr:flagellar assembly protein FliW [Kineococcus rhizosphaerae]PRY18257.1 flagellar assembly factor FliW [Kineococcus rhizosphaerae]